VGFLHEVHGVRTLAAVAVAAAWLRLGTGKNVKKRPGKGVENEGRMKEK
jgi:hypothetical protein